MQPQLAVRTGLAARGLLFEDGGALTLGERRDGNDLARKNEPDLAEGVFCHLPAPGPFVLLFQVCGCLLQPGAGGGAPVGAGQVSHDKGGPSGGWARGMQALPLQWR